MANVGVRSAVGIMHASSACDSLDDLSSRL